MKTLFFTALLFLGATRIYSQANQGNSEIPQDTEYAIASRQANSITWQRTTYERDPDGNVVGRVHQYNEVATGLNFKNPDTGEWEASSEEIEQISGGAVAQHGQHKVIFAGDIATYGAIDMETPNGQRLQSHLIGLSYFDRSSGQSVFIAEITNSIGQLIGNNQVWYDDAFAGLKAGVRYTYTREGFEQDVILEEQPLAPEAYGLNSSTTVLQAFTEFISPPTPTILTNSLGNQLSDETLCFGTMRVGRGRAFLTGNNSSSCPVCKEWVTLEGRHFLIEEVPITQIATELQTLPQYQASLRVSNSVVNVVSKKRLLPAQPLAKAGKAQMKLAKLADLKPGFVIDYTSLNSSLTNYTFQSGATYYISGNVDLYGAATAFEGDAVLKYASGANLTVNTPVTWQAGAYRPVVMVAMDDNTVGEPISGSTGSPGNGYYAGKALYFDGTSASASLTVDNLRILNAKAGVVINGSSGHLLKNIQALVCNSGIAATNTDFTLHNALFDRVLTNFTGLSATAYVEHLTASKSLWLNKDIGSNLFLTNCLLVAVTNLGSCTTGSVAVLTSASNPFQTVGGGSFYLATNSPYRNFGTTNISADTLAILSHKTTYPPIVYADTSIDIVTTFNPVVQRDFDVPDLGYHYDPLDYAFSGTAVNTNINFSAGTAVGWFCLGSDTYGLHLADKQIATFDGTVTSPSCFVRSSTVQEGGNGNWTKSWAISGFIGTADQYSYNVALSPELRIRFTDCSAFSSGEQIFRDSSGYIIIRANNCRITGGNQVGYIISYYLTNCLIDGGQMGTVAGWTGNEMYLRNCTMHEDVLYIDRYHSPAMQVSIRDCALDQVTVYTNSDSFITNPSYTDFDYNAYTNAATFFPLGSSHDQKSVTFDWQTGPLGNFYLPWYSALIDHGSRTADQAGLYHFTTQTDQTKEANSTVDIGYHYVALDGYGNPIDTDGDGTPDYIEDANGNGAVDSGETDWQSATDLGLKVVITRPKNNSVIP
jgi:hypothetical protein